MTEYRLVIFLCFQLGSYAYYFLTSLFNDKPGCCIPHSVDYAWISYGLIMQKVSFQAVHTTLLWYLLRWFELFSYSAIFMVYIGCIFCIFPFFVHCSQILHSCCRINLCHRFLTSSQPHNCVKLLTFYVCFASELFYLFTSSSDHCIKSYDY